MSKTDVLDVLGITFLSLFAGFIWTPACLLVIGAAALLMSWRATT